jgi:hypothetical protein
MRKQRGPARALIAILSVALTGLPFRAHAQELRGAVRDSTAQQAIPGVVLLLLDANGAVLGRNITNERGEYRIALSPGIERVRFIRIGFRPREALVPPVENGVARLDVVMRSLPTMLEAVRVSANAKCPSRDDSPAALALLDQARAGLLATIVARDANPADLVRLAFDRNFDDDDRILSQTIRIDSVKGGAKSFSAVLAASDFVSRGFMSDSAGSQVFYGPDAEVLLDERFSTGYCFRIADRERARPAAQIGLVFSPAERRRTRVDIEGTLWIDTVARALSDIDYRYLGLDARTNSVRPGGRISFREMRNGVVLIDRWSLRLPTVEREYVYQGTREQLREWFRPAESGGELVRATWSENYSWHGSFGTISGIANGRDGKPVSGILMHLPGTPYRAITDSAGRFEFSDVFPGPYRLAMIEPNLAAIGLEIPIADSLIAIRESVVRRSFVARSLRDYVADRCATDKRPAAFDATLLFGRGFAPGTGSIAGVVITFFDVDAGKQLPGSYKVGTDGTFLWCGPGLSVGRRIRVEARERGSIVGVSAIQLEQPVTIIRLEITPRSS